MPDRLQYLILKNVNSIRIILFAVLLPLFLYACEIEPNSPSGDFRDNIVDTWSCKETSITSNNTSTYPSDISKHPTDSSKVLIDNFYQIGIGYDAYAILNKYTLTIPLQNIRGFSIKGSGTISANFKSINFSYSVDDGSGQIDQVTALYSKY